MIKEIKKQHKVYKNINFPQTKNKRIFNKILIKMMIKKIFILMIKE